ncbi:MAG: hypothetical protein KTR32_27350, partial [Granulosicoccus sp.]|nr:hypothetical protein [Granulosicoccus sp.]
MSAVFNTLRGLLIAADAVAADAPTPAEINTIVSAGVFRPSENERFGYWFARYLTVRQALWDLISEVLAGIQQQLHHEPLPLPTEQSEWKRFVVGYSAACLLIRLDRILLFDVATHSLVQRKLNEAFPEYRIPRKQYTLIFSAFVNRADALVIYDAIRLARKNRGQIDSLADDPDVGYLVERFDTLQSYLDPSKRNYLKRLLSYASHKWRRKGVVSLSNSLARVMERFGRAASVMKLPLPKRVTPDLIAEMGLLLQPGDVLVTRHDHALTNLFLPGFWPHSALYIGTVDQREALGISASVGALERWSGDRCVLEALKDGVLFRPLRETLSVDYVVVLRPELSTAAIRTAIERVICHEGKLYNFDFDFFNAERLVCTEVIYRAFDGLEGLVFPLTDRANRKTLSAEDLLDYALDSGRLKPLLIFGVDHSEKKC